MKYFYSTSDLWEVQNFEPIPKGQIVEYESDSRLISSQGKIVIPSKNIGNSLKFELNGNEIYFFHDNNIMTKNTFIVDDILFDIGDTITISTGSDVVVKAITTSIEFESTEIYGDYKLIYFSGNRRFVVIQKNKKIIFASYYDMQNFDKGKTFVCKCNDMLNHAKVFGIKDNKFENYLIYLDDFELKLKDEFVPFVFLDCLIAGNYKYCKALLLNQTSDIESIKRFFPEFDSYISMTNTTHLLINKNTPQGICEFELVNDKISNIIL